jgi:hypothetical protein
MVNSEPGIEIAQRFVHREHGGLPHHGTSERDPLPRNSEECPSFFAKISPCVR